MPTTVPHLDRLASALPQIMWTATTEGSADYFTAFATGYAGLSESALLGAGWLDVVHPDDQPAVRKAMAEGIAAETTYETEYRLRRHDGVYRWFTGQVVPVRDATGRLVGWAGSAVDITDRKERESEARRVLEERAFEIRERLRLALQGSLTSMWDYEVHDGVIGKSRLDWHNNLYESRGRKDTGAAADFSTATNLFVAPEHRDRVLAAMKACVDGTAPVVQEEYRALGYADGLEHWRLARGVVIRDATGAATRFLGTSVDITELKRAQEEARRNRERLELALRAAQACTWDFELTGPLANVQPTLSNFWELLGYDPADPPADRPSGVMPSDERDAFLANVQAILDGSGTEWETEYRVIHKDGSHRWHLSRGVVARDADGRPRRFLGTSVDITDRKQAEQALRESEERRFRGTFQNAAVGMALTTRGGQLVEHNEKFAALLGYSEEELAGRSITDLVAAEYAALGMERFARVSDGALPYFTQDTQFVRRDGSKLWGNITVSVILRDASGAPSRIMTVLQDISERKSLEAELRRTTEHLEVAVRSSNLGIWEYDMPDGTLETARETLTNVWEPLGYTSGDELPSGTAGLIHPDDRSRVSDQINAYLSGKAGVFETEHRVRRRDGSYRWVLGRGVAVRDSAGRPTRFVGTNTDVTDLKRIEAELHDAREAAESANRAKDEFLANVSHEIRTPMNAIVGMTEVALDASETDRQRQLLSTVKSAARSLVGIIDDLLDFSKIDAGMLTLDVAEFALRSTLGDTLRALAARAHRKGLELFFHVHEDVPDALTGDAGRLRQVLMNLVGNAIKFTHRGEVVVEVAMAGPLRAGDDKVSIAFIVRDTGVGIAPEKHAVIFRPFEQADASTTRKYGGTGLGLTISAQLAALMGGAITVESEPGRGSTFRFTAIFVRGSTAGGLARGPLDTLDTLEHASSDESPAFPARSRQAGVQASVSKPVQHTELLETISAVMTGPQGPTRPGEVVVDDAPPRGPRKLRILVAEDNELNVAVLKELLRQRGEHARFASNGREALTLLDEGVVDVLLVDLHMPEMDGFQVVETIRRKERTTGEHLRIIALTARSSIRDRERALAVGMDDFLPKPIDVDALWAALERVPATLPGAKAERSKLLDATAILRICGGQQTALEQLSAVFRSAVTNQMARVRSAHRTGDLADLSEAAHKLRGTVSAFSSVAGALAASLEDAAVRNEVESCDALVHRLGAMSDELVEATRSLTIDALDAQQGDSNGSEHG